MLNRESVKTWICYSNCTIVIPSSLLTETCKVSPLCNQAIIQMILRQLGANQTELSFNNGTSLFFSYETPVAAQLPNFEYIKTATKWSKTTTRHINKWLDGVTAKEVKQDVLNNLVKG